MTQCNCANTDNDICFECLDPYLDELWQEMINGTAGRNIVDLHIAFTTELLTMIKNPNYAAKATKEIQALRILRERQTHD